ncbi:MAG: hypothetical protein DRN49_04955 [Thaumarchaeota archaeon]|nr:MAG: hypothetical protein DRN49_04955 [Nitrososphaerota archaeon]
MNIATLYAILKRKRVIIGKKAITMFDLITQVVNDGVGVKGALVRVTYNTTEREQYTNTDGIAVFEDIPSNISQLKVYVNITEAWIRSLRITEDWELLFKRVLRITEDWEEAFIAQPQITEDWEEAYVAPLRITEDWEEIFTAPLKITEDWEDYITLQLRLTEDWES